MLQFRSADLYEIWQHPADHLGSPIGSPGYALPRIDKLVKSQLPGRNNWVLHEADVPAPAVEIIRDACDNLLIFGAATKRVGRTTFAGSNNIGIMCGHTLWPTQFELHLNANGGTFFFGKGSTATSAIFGVTGDKARIVIGEDCMLSHAVMVRTHDQHSIIDMTDGEWINPPQQVIIEPHVWLGQETLILKGAHIGFGAIVAARATVTGPVPRYAIVAGTPARVVRENVSWVREQAPAPGAWDSIRAAQLRFDS